MSDELGAMADVPPSERKHSASSKRPSLAIANWNLDQANTWQARSTSMESLVRAEVRRLDHRIDDIDGLCHEVEKLTASMQVPATPPGVLSGAARFDRAHPPGP